MTGWMGGCILSQIFESIQQMNLHIEQPFTIILRNKVLKMLNPNEKLHFQDIQNGIVNI